MSISSRVVKEEEALLRFVKKLSSAEGDVIDVAKQTGVGGEVRRMWRVEDLPLYRGG